MGGLEGDTGHTGCPLLREREWIDAQDCEGNWLEAQVVSVSVGSVRVHFKGFESKHDESLPSGSGKLAVLHTHTRPLCKRDEGLRRNIGSGDSDLVPGALIDALDSSDKWFASRVLEVDAKRGLIKITYIGWNRDYDEWVRADSYRLARNGLHCDHARPGRQKSDIIVASQSVEAQYRAAALRARGFDVVEMGADGNCLFRAISHQIYGTEDHHAMVRSRVLDYVETEAAFFRQYVFDENFSAYVARLRRSGEWGGEVEIRAACEMYGRVVEIYHYSLEPKEVYTPPTSAAALGSDEKNATCVGGGGSSGAAPMDLEEEIEGERGTTTHDTSTQQAVQPDAAPDTQSTTNSTTNRTTNTAQPASERVGQTRPIRLSFHWNSHYNSLAPLRWGPDAADARAMRPGEMETQSLATARARSRNKRSGGALSSEWRALEAALATSRREFENRDLNEIFTQKLIGAAKAESLSSTNKQALDKAISMSLRASEERMKKVIEETRAEAEARQIDIATERSVSDAVKEAKSRSLQDVETSQLRTVIAQSLKEQDARILDAELLASALRQSASAATKRAREGPREGPRDGKEESKWTTASADALFDDDFAVQAAIEASMRS